MANVPGFTSDELSLVDGKLPGISGNQKLRFIQHCIEYYRGWRDRIASQKNQSNVNIPTDSVLVLVLSDSPKLEPKLDVSLCDVDKKVFKISYSLCQGLAVCTENLESIRKLFDSFDSSDSALEFVENNLSDKDIFVIIFTMQGRYLVHQHGEQISDWVKDPPEFFVEVNDNEINSDTIEQQIEKFHVEGTAKPQGLVARTMWNRSDKTKLALYPLPEIRVQSGLLIHLRAWYRSVAVFIDEEIPNANGRLDIRVARVLPGSQKTVTTILELKVLSPSNSPKKNRDWAISGVTQANSYRQPDTDICFACIFDARATKEDVAGLEESATAHNVKVLLKAMEPPPIIAKSKSDGHKVAEDPKKSMGSVGKKSTGGKNKSSLSTKKKPKGGTNKSVG